MIFVTSVRAHIATIDAIATVPLTKPPMQSPTQAPIPNMQTSALPPDDFGDDSGNDDCDSKKHIPIFRYHVFNQPTIAYWLSKHRQSYKIDNIWLALD